MTDNEIIRCLRLCRAGDCENCKALNVCDATFSFHKEALDLINRQKAEIERLQDYNENLQTANTALSNEILEIKSEAIKEFAERLKEKCYEDFQETYSMLCPYDTDIDIDNLVKEMTEEKEK